MISLNSMTEHKHVQKFYFHFSTFLQEIKTDKAMKSVIAIMSYVACERVVAVMDVQEWIGAVCLTCLV